MMKCKEVLTKGDMLDLGLLVSYIEACCILDCSISNISHAVRRGYLEQIVYKNKRYITLLSILLYKGDVKPGEVVVFKQRVNPIKKRKEIEILAIEDWHGFCAELDEQIESL
jgi:hypothetical protein